MGCTASSDAPKTKINHNSKTLAIKAQEDPESVRSVGSSSFDSCADIDEKEIQNFLSKNQFFKHLNQNLIKKAAETLIALEVAKGEEIVKPGEEADGIFIVMKGSIVLCKDDPTASLRNVNVNDCFGSVGFYFEAKRTFTAKAKTNSTILKLTKEAYKANKKSTFLKTIGNWIEGSALEMVNKNLRQVELFEGLTVDKLQQVSKLFSLKSYEKGSQVFKEGDTGSEYYIVSDGELVVTIGDPRDPLSVTEVKRLTRYQPFGEISLVEKKPRTASVTALNVSTLLVLKKEDFDFILQIAPEIHNLLLDKIEKRRAVSGIMKKNIPFVQNLKVNKLHILSSVCQPYHYRPKDYILMQGSHKPKSFFILAEGSVDVSINKQKVRSLDQPGQYFGELSLVSNKNHSATVRAGKNGCIVLAISQGEFQALFQDEASVYAEIALRVLGRESELKFVLQHPVSRKKFLEHCEKEFAQENTDFYLAAEELEDMANHRVKRDILEAFGHDVEQVVAQRSEELRNKCHKIFDQFIDPNGPTPININATLRDSLTESIENGEYSYELFAEAKVAVFELIERDNFSRFTKSEAFKDLLADLGVYGEEEKHRSLTRNLDEASEKFQTTLPRSKKHSKMHRRDTVGSEKSEIRSQIVD